MSFLPKSEWTQWAAEWGLQHFPQKGWLYRDERVAGLKDGLLVQVGWGGEKNARLLVLIRFPKAGDVALLRDVLIADPALDALPGKGAGRRKMARATATPKVQLGAIPEFTLGERELLWSRAFPWRHPKAAEVRAWVETLLGAVRRATAPFDGRCEQCGAAGVSRYVLVDAIPKMLCASCQQQMRSEGEMAERTYDMSEARHGAGFAAGAVAALLGAAIWAALAAGTGRIFAVAAIGIGALVAWAYKRAAGRVDGAGRAIAVALTLASVAFGDVLYVAWLLWQRHPEWGFAVDRALIGYLGVWIKSPGIPAVSLFFGLLGAWFATRALQRPQLHADIRQADEDPRQTKRAA